MAVSRSVVVVAGFALYAAGVVRADKSSHYIKEKIRKNIAGTFVHPETKATITIDRNGLDPNSFIVTEMPLQNGKPAKGLVERYSYYDHTGFPYEMRLTYEHGANKTTTRHVMRQKNGFIQDDITHHLRGPAKSKSRVREIEKVSFVRFRQGKTRKAKKRAEKIAQIDNPFYVEPIALKDDMATYTRGRPGKRQHLESSLSFEDHVLKKNVTFGVKSKLPTYYLEDEPPRMQGEITKTSLMGYNRHGDMIVDQSKTTSTVSPKKLRRKLRGRHLGYLDSLLEVQEEMTQEPLK